MVWMDNRPFLSCRLPLGLHAKMSLRAKHLIWQWVWFVWKCVPPTGVTKTRFETEAQGNLEMPYFIFLFCFKGELFALLRTASNSLLQTWSFKIFPVKNVTVISDNFSGADYFLRTSFSVTIESFLLRIRDVVWDGLRSELSNWTYRAKIPDHLAIRFTSNCEYLEALLG